MSEAFTDKKLLLLGNMLECTKGESPDLSTAVVCTSDGENLYFSFTCQSDCMTPKHNGFNDPLFEGDIVEILLSLEHRNHYLEIEVNQNNAQYCVLIDNDGNGNFSVTKMDAPCFSSSVNINENEWECEIILPKKELTRLNINESDCYINLLRQDYDKNGVLRLYCVYPTLCGSFHRSERFEKFTIK